MQAAAGPATPSGGKASEHRVYNFGAGPATLPLPVLRRIQEEFLDFRGLGAGIVEISHRSGPFLAVMEEMEALLRELMGIPRHYRVLYCHGGGQLQFSMVAMNLLGLKPAHKALYVDSGTFSARAAEIASLYGYVRVIASSRNTGYDRIPAYEPEALDPDASYLHLTTNNTAMGTRWAAFPETGSLPLVGDMTSEILSRRIDVSRFGMIYAGAQKNLAPPGLAVVIVREDLLGKAQPFTPALLDYTRLAEERSLGNTVNTFSLYVMGLMLAWLRDEGGMAVMERRNAEKAARVYEVLDRSAFYRPFARPPHRSHMNVTFTLPDEALLQRFLAESVREGLYALKGHSARGGVRASLYNAMPLEGAGALAAFMTEFERRHG